ncbi:hypothetical protein SEA_CAMBIARE_25 [Mycobacterium phage Cambiare]|uniref:Uncharacterized protein n=2 Tax=Avocadovirus TaxID=2946813 RepID=A0A222Z0E7_9CAUD|nr:head protein [Mycobacterium phage Cambiare]YP_010051496.1 head protein [Mycobacterium phage Avocado]AKF14527.1 hypothetical protein SEA_CAMBIARE_25 [Mycobacterium phage Cambiare]ASR77226.1 hypothetical protein SEA_AVOCADO_24 [Mycobacterium phage Avocado]
MTVGPTAYLVNKLLDHALRNVIWTPPSIVYFKGHLGDPGAVGANNAAATTTRIAVSFTAAAAGVVNLSGTPELTLLATENISHGSLWDANANGNCLWTAAAGVVKGGAANDIIRLTTLQFGFTGLAA